MHIRLLACAAIVALSAAVTAGTAAAQAADPNFKPPRTSWGAPQLSGVWSNASLTTLQRPANAPSVVIPEDQHSKVLARNQYAMLAKDEAGVSKIDKESSDKLLADKNSNRGYNHFWTDAGRDYARVGADLRSAWITNPADGMIPYIPGKQPRQTITYDGPEGRPNGERCLTWSNLGPVLRNGMYNNNFQFVQTPTHFMINAEMIHEFRVIPIVASKADVKHGPKAMKNFGGDSVAYYDGDTLVVETVNVRQDQRPYITETGKVTERFKRWKDDEIYYQFEVEDPSIYSAKWSGDMVLRSSNENVYEFACHEGNYGMHGILAGARKLERDGREHPPEISIFAGLAADE